MITLYIVRAVLEEASSPTGDSAVGPLVLCPDSQAFLSMLDAGTGAQTTSLALGVGIWRLLAQITARGQEVAL